MTIAKPFSPEELKGLGDEDIEELNGLIYQEQMRRQKLASAPVEMDRIAKEYQEANGTLKTSEGAWEQPTSAVDSYAKGDVVTHDGKTWTNLINVNVWEPGVSGWREESKVSEDGETTTYPEWKQPQAHEVYMSGDKVSFQGDTWESVMDNNAWSPETHPQGWKKL